MVFDWQSAESAGGQSCGHFFAINGCEWSGSSGLGRSRRARWGWWVLRDPPQPGRWSFGAGGWAPSKASLVPNCSGSDAGTEKGGCNSC